MSVVTTLSGVCGVVGLTSLNQELFVLQKTYKDNQVNVYSTNSSSVYTCLRRFSVNGLSMHWYNDMTSCARRECLYISDCYNKCVHEVNLDGHVTAKWPVSDRPAGLSLTSGGNVLVTCFHTSKVIELNSSTGRRVRVIALQLDIQYPQHAVQLAAHLPSVQRGARNNCFVVSHAWGSRLHRVCFVDSDGKVSLSYGELNNPRHVVVDRDNFLFVADSGNRRLALLSPGLQLVRHVQLEEEPRRLYLDHVTRRLYVGGDRVTVIQV